MTNFKDKYRNMQNSSKRWSHSFIEKFYLPLFLAHPPSFQRCHVTDLSPTPSVPYRELNSSSLQESKVNLQVQSLNSLYSDLTRGRIVALLGLLLQHWCPDSFGVPTKGAAMAMDVINPSRRSYQNRGDKNDQREAAAKPVFAKAVNFFSASRKQKK